MKDAQNIRKTDAKRKEKCVAHKIEKQIIYGQGRI